MAMGLEVGLLDLDGNEWQSSQSCRFISVETGQVKGSQPRISKWTDRNLGGWTKIIVYSRNFSNSPKMVVSYIVYDAFV
jgi:hypothetical protein